MSRPLPRKRKSKMHNHTATEKNTEGGQPMTVGQWVARFPQSAQVFDARGIDYCCGGKLSLDDACNLKGLDPAVLKSDLAELRKNPGPSRAQDWENAPLKVLVDHIESIHHAYIRSERPRLMALAQKVARVHGPRHPELVELAVTVEQVFRELDPHLEKEERDVFPICRTWSDRERQESPDSGLVSAVIGIEAEHLEVGRLLAVIRKLTMGYRPPQDACNSYLALFHGLERFEADLHEHIHLENNILHSRITSAAGKSKEGHGSPDTCCGICSVS